MEGVAFLTLLAVAAITDLRTRTIPNWIPLAIALLAVPSLSVLKVTGILLGLPFYICGLIEPKGMGGGDIKLVAAAGLYLGILNGCAGLIIGLALVLLYAMAKGKAMGPSVALGPFLALGFAAANFI